MQLDNATPLYDFLDEFQRASLSQPIIWMQVLVVFGCLLGSWLVSRALRPRIKAEGERNHWRFGSEGIARVLFPLLFWLVTEAATYLWREGHSVALLKLVSSLGFALVVVRTALYILQAIFAEAAWVRRHERRIASLIWLVFAIHLVNASLFPALGDSLDGIIVPLGKQHVSVLTIINAIVSVALTVLFALWIGRVFEQRVMRMESINMSLRVVMTKFTRTLLIVLAVLIALPLVGIDLTVLSVFGGAVGVGLGFGLQKVASNYVSGFIILLDGSIRIGDLVNIEGRQGTITNISARYVVLKVADGTEAIIPNEVLISSTVLNLSHSDKLLRVPLSVLVAYGTDLDQAIACLLACTENVERVLSEPAPQVFVKTFAENGIELELAVWISDPHEGTLGLRSGLNLKIWRAFNDQGIEIPYPTRQVHIVHDEATVSKL
jgi:small-conductance mechanosensitive channel